MVLAGFIWTAHRDDSGERIYLSRVMQAAADWTDVLINMNSGNIDASLQRLHDGTVGQLNTDFDAAVQPYRAGGGETADPQQRARSRRWRSIPCTATWTPARRPRARW